MKHLDPIIENTLRETSSWRRLVGFLRRSALVGTIAAAGAFLLGAAAVEGWLTHAGWYRALFALVLVGAALAWFVAVAVTLAAPDRRRELAAAVEHAQDRLLDRLNTLVYLQEHEGQAHPYQRPIEEQARRILKQAPPHDREGLWLLARDGAIFALALAATVLFYGRYQPRQHLAAATIANAPSEEPSLEIPAPREPATGPDSEAPWGEVRITRPGVDLRTTRAEVIALRIEAASNRSIARVEWLTSINGQPEVVHPLPRPTDFTMAVYAPSLDLPALELVDWDVLAYYAQAVSEDGQTWKSDIYFVDVVPFREELEKVPGGPEGAGVALLEQLTAMVEAQQAVFRETQRGEQPGEETEKHRDELRRQESDLQAAVRHLAAQIDGLAPGEAAAGLKEGFRQAQSALAAAAGTVAEKDLAESLRKEQSALAELVELRKAADEFIRKNPGAFTARKTGLVSKRKPEPPAEADPNGLDPAAWQPVLEREIDQYAKIEKDPSRFKPDDLKQAAQATQRRLQRLLDLTEKRPADDPVASELRQELGEKQRKDLAAQAEKLGRASDRKEQQEAAGAVKKQLERLAEKLASGEAEDDEARGREHDKRLESLKERSEQFEKAREAVAQALSAERTLQREAKTPLEARRLAPRQREVNRSLQEQLRNNPEAQASCSKECAAASRAMQQAADTMASGRSTAREKLGQAADSLQRLDDALQRQQQDNRLAEAHQLKRALDEQARRLEKMERKPADKESRCATGGRCKGAAGGLKQLAGQEPLNKEFGPALGGALGDEARQRIDAQAQRLEKAETPDEQRKAAGDLRKSVEGLSRAFDKSCPSALSSRPKQGGLRPTGPEAVERGLRQLENLAQLPPDASGESRSRMGREAMANLQEGAAPGYGYNDRIREMLDKIRKALQRPDPKIDLKTVDDLARAIEGLAREVAPARIAPLDPAEQTHVDPSRYPPAYRRPIERYFKKLSERP